MEPKLTFGEKRVVKSFNPSKFPIVTITKKLSAELIDHINDNITFIDEYSKEGNRLKELAMTAIEEGCMWANKAATLYK